MAKLDISQLTEAASANARTVGGAAKETPAKPAAKPRSRPKAAAAAAPAASAAPAAPERPQSKSAAGRSSTNKRRPGTRRLSLDIPPGDLEAFREFAKARRHSQETVFRAALQILLATERREYLDIVEDLPQG